MIVWLVAVRQLINVAVEKQHKMTCIILINWLVPQNFRSIYAIIANRTHLS